MSDYEDMVKAFYATINMREDPMAFIGLFCQGGQQQNVAQNVAFNRPRPPAPPPRQVPQIRKDIKREKRKEIKKIVKMVPQGPIQKEEAKADKGQLHLLKDGKTTPLDPILSKQIEECISNDVKEYSYLHGNTEYSINLKTMIRTNLTDNTTAKLVRINTNPKVPPQPVEEIKHSDVSGNGHESSLVGYGDAPEWNGCKITRLQDSSSEYKSVANRFNLTMKGNYKFVTVEKLNNAYARYFFDKKLTQMSLERKVSKESLVLQLFHGTKDTDPKEIYNGGITTFDPKYARKGLWGSGTYFAANASYSNKFAHKRGSTMQVFLAEVIVGN